MDRILSKVGFLAGLSSEDQRGLFEHATRRTFAKGEVILAQGAQNDRLHLVETGTLHVRRRTEGHDVMLGRLEPGAFFGEMSLFDPAPTSAEVTGVVPGTLVEVTREALDRFMATRPAAAQLLLTALLALLSHRLRDADDRIADSVRWGGLVS